MVLVLITGRMDKKVGGRAVTISDIWSKSRSIEAAVGLERRAIPNFWLGMNIFVSDAGCPTQAFLWLEWAGFTTPSS
jgi:hypothetical protein